MRRRGLDSDARLFPVGKRLLRRAWEEIRAAAGLDGARLHDLRHTFAATLLEDGVPLKTSSTTADTLP